MADLSALGGLKPIEPLNLGTGEYADVKERKFQLPSAGIYTLRAPDSFPPSAFSRTQKTGALSIQIDPTIVGPEHEGFLIKFVKVSGTLYKRDGKMVSQIGDYLRACGVDRTLSDEQEQADAVESTANTTYNAYVDWKVFNRTTGFSLEGMKRFPLKKDAKGNAIAGEYQSWVEDPNDFETDEVGSQKVDGDGNPIHKRLRANLFIREFKPVARG